MDESGTTASRGARPRPIRPELAFVVLATVFGVLLALWFRPFAGFDEQEHYLRTYQLTQLRALPEKRHGVVGGVFPSAVVRSVHAEADTTLFHPRPRLYDFRHFFLTGRERADQRAHRVFGGFLNNAYSPFVFAPGAVGMAIGRALHASPLGLLYLARFTNLAAFVLLVALAIRRFPKAGWLFCVIGLLPTALFQGASISADGVTMGMTFLVVASALARLDPGFVATRRTTVEAVGLCVAIGLCKPPYLLVASLYLLPLARRANRRLGPALLLAAPVALAGAVYAAWAAYASPTFVPIRETLTQRHRDIDVGRQLHVVLHSPDTFLAAVAHLLRTDGWTTLRESIGSLGRMSGGLPLWLVLCWAALLLVATWWAATSSPALSGATRAALGGLALVLLVGILLTLYVGNTPVGRHGIDYMQGRYYLPLFPLVLLLAPRLRRMAPVLPVLVTGALAALWTASLVVATT